MKKIKLLIAFFAAIFGSVQGTWARTAPTLTEQTLESGKSYDLYNVGFQNYAHWYSSYAKTGKNNIEPVLFTQQDNGKWTMYFIWSCKYFNGARMSDTPAECEITKVEKGYTFSFNNQLLTATGEYTTMTTGGSGDNATWILYDNDELWHYFAKKNLYDALEEAVATDYSTEYSAFIESCDAIYENEASTNDELNNAATALKNSLPMSQGYQAPYWNEYPILFATSAGSFGQDYNSTWALPNSSQDINGNTIYYSSGSQFYTRFGRSTGSRTLSAIVAVDELSTFVYSTSGGNGNDDFDSKIQIYVDDKLVRTLIGPQINTYPNGNTYARFFEVLQPGTHTIKWVASSTNSSNNVYFNIWNVGVVKSPLITVSLLEPGSLGTEVLYNTDHIKNVRRLKVKGAMNSDDWAKIKMMSGLLDLDLSEAEFTEVPERQFCVGTGNDTIMQFLHRLVLPEGITKINKEAFYFSFIDHLALPSTLKNIRENAFYGSHIQEIEMPDDCTEIYGDETYNNYAVFYNMKWLRKLTCAKNWTIIPQYTFYNCTFLEDVTLPEKLEAIGGSAFGLDRYLKINFPEGLKRINGNAFQWCYWAEFGAFPESLQSIGASAFYGCNNIVNLIVPKNVSSLGNYAFGECNNLKTAELGVNLYTISNQLFTRCNKLEAIRLNSATVVRVTDNSNYYPVDANRLKDVDLIVPHYLVNSYKLDKYWYNFKSITGFDYSSIDFIPIHGKLTLNHERFGGQPTIHIIEDDCYLKINGENEQKFDEIWISTHGTGNTGQLLNNCDNVTASGDNRLDYWTEAKKWYFISLPFDLDVSRITPWSDGAQFAIRYYDGAGRAANGKSGNWKNVDLTGTIPAGTGFIYQTNIATWTGFYAADTENKYGTLRTTEFNKTLAVNASESASDKGWNLVGNPYQCFYNNHCLNFTAPITIWSPNNSTYTAYSLTDDDYAIRPNEAFFVQCPNGEYNTLGFPLQGRQLTSVIESQNAVKAWAPEAKTRQIVNLSVSNGEMEDMTRVVLNEEASMAYETSCDASKFMSMDGSVPQIYTLDAEGTQYAINERPFGEGTVELGFYTGQAGDYTISVTRCDAEQVFITDKLTGEITEITNNSYTFSAKTGTDNTRFILSFVSNDATSIKEVDKAEIAGKTDIYSVDGKFLGTDPNGLGAGIYVLRQGKKVSKVIVR